MISQHQHVFIRHRLSNDAEKVHDMDKSMDGKTVLITGATSGIGQASAVGLAKRGATLVLVGRNEEKTKETVSDIKQETGNSNINYLLCDLASLASVRKLAKDFTASYPRLDVLLNNAGVIMFKRQLTVDGYEYTFAVNYLAHFLLSTLMLDVLKRSAPARIINVSSEAHATGHLNFDDLMGARKYRPMGAYSQSKLAAILFTRELARRLAATGVTANCLHPGFVASNFGHNMGIGARFMFLFLRPFQISVAKGAETSIYLASSPEVANLSGLYFTKKKSVEPSSEAKDDALAARLWDISEQLTRGS